MKSLARLFRFLRDYRLWAILAPLSMVIEVAMDLMQPRVLQSIIDQGVRNHDFTFVVNHGILMICLALIGLVGGCGSTFFGVKASQGFGTDLRLTLYKKVQSFSFGNLDRLETGSLITRLTNDVTQVQDAVLMVLRILVRAPLMLIGSLIMAVITSPRQSVVFVVLIPVVLGALSIVIRRMYPLFSGVQARLDAINNRLQENLSGVRVVKAFARRDHEIQLFGQANAALMDQATTAGRFGAVTMPIMMLSMNFGIVSALWIGGLKVSTGEMTVGQVVAFINYLMQTLMSLMFVSMLITQLARAGASAERVEEVLHAEPDIPDSGHAGVPPGGGELRFDHVTFGYGDDPVLRDVSFTAEPGQTVAILGATGSGKTSLALLIPRFYDVTGGRILLDGKDIREIDGHALREAVTIALQESVLFSGTIADNIRYGKPDAPDKAVTEAATVAQAAEFIERLPDGYESAVGQRGVNLSGGQKQRLAIARAILPKPRVLVLDDSTSAVDVRTESKIHDALPHGCTRIIVAQRISTVQSADRIIVLDGGQVAAEGTHEELLESSPLYRDIYESQTSAGAVVGNAE